MGLRSAANSGLAANKHDPARASRRSPTLIVGPAALVLAMATLLAAVTIVRAGATEPIPPNVALTGQNRAGCVATSGPLAGQSVFPGEPRARSLALSSQRIGEVFVRSVALTGENRAGCVATSGPLVRQSVFPGEALARSLALSSQALVDSGGK